MKRYKYNYGKNPEGALSTISGYATETTNFGETAFGILNKSTRDEENFTTPEVVSSSTATLFSVGNGTDHDSRKNIIELKADGTVYINGVGQYDGTNPGEATDIADEFQGIHDDITGLNEDVDRIDNTIESIHISEDDENLIYTLLVDGQERGTINIPRDQFLKNVSYNEETNNLEFTFIVRGENNEEVEKQVNVNMTDLEDIYSAGDGLNLENKQFSVKVDADTQPYIEVTANGVKIIGVNEALDKKVSWDESKKVITLPADGSISALRNNGLEGGVLVCQRTYDDGATYVTEVGTTKNNLTLNSIERPKIDFAGGTSENIAYESEVKSLQDRMSTAETDIDNLEDRMDTAESDIDTIQSDLSGLMGGGEGSVQDQIKTALEDYLPLAGGTLTGDVEMENAGLTINGATLIVQNGLNGQVSISSDGMVNMISKSTANALQIGNGISDAQGWSRPIAIDYNAENPSVIVNLGANTAYDTKLSKTGLEVVSDDSTASYMSSGVTISNKTENDLLNAAGGTTSVDSIKEGLATEDALNEYKTSNDAEIAALKSKDIELSNKIDSIHIPSKVSELENDSKYQTEDQVNSRIQAVVDSAPEALDTLKEIGDALGNDPDFAATMTNKLTEINSKIGSNTYTGANYISKETNLTDTVMQLDEEIKAANDNLDLEHANAEATYAKKTDLSGYLPLTGGNVTGKIFSADSIEIGRKFITGTLQPPHSRINSSGFSNYSDPEDGDTDAVFIVGNRIDDWNNWGGVSPGMTIHTTNGITRYYADGVTIPNKTASDLLNAARGTVSIQDIISQVTVPTKVSELTNDSGYQTEAQVAAKVSALVDSAPETLDTLNELAAALGDDPNFAITVTNQIAQKADKTTATTSADGLMSAADKAKLDSIETSTLATKDELEGYLPLSGGTLTGYLKMRELDGSELKHETFSLDLVQGYLDSKDAYMKFDVHPSDYSTNRTMIEIGNLIDSNTTADSSDVLGIYSDFFQARFNPISRSFAVCYRPNTSKDVMWSNITLSPRDDDEAYVRITSYLGDSKDPSNFNQAIYKSTGITFRNKTASDLLHAAGGTTTLKTINGESLLGSGDIITPTPTVNAASGTKTIWTGTQSEYEAVSPKDANTLYFITEG